MKRTMRSMQILKVAFCGLALAFGSIAAGALFASQAWAAIVSNEVAITYHAGEIGGQFSDGEKTRVQSKTVGEPIEISDVLPEGTAKGAAVSVQLEPCGGTFAEGQKNLIQQGYTVTHTFVSWNTKEDGSGDTYKIGQKYEGDEALDLWAQYSTEDNNESDTLPAVTRDGYVLDGWYTAETDGEKIGNAGDQLPLSSVFWGGILYAHWTVNQEAVQAEAQSATPAAAAPATPPVAQQPQSKIVATGDGFPVGIALIAVVATAMSIGIGIKRRH